MKMRHINQFLAAISVASLVTVTNAAELSGTPEELRRYLQAETRTVTLNEEATEKAQTDIAKVTLIVTSEAKRMSDAMRQNNDLRDKVASLVEKLGIKREDISSSKYAASPQFGWFGKTPSSFTIVNKLVVKVDSDARFRGVAAIADDRDEVAFGGAEFEHSEKAAYEEKVRASALQGIMDDSKYFAENLKLQLTPVSFAYSDVSARRDSGHEYLEEVVVTANQTAVMSSVAPTPAPKFDEVEYRVVVSVVFEVSPID